MSLLTDEKVKRTLPVNYNSRDDYLFRHELEKSFPEISLLNVGTGFFYPNGLIQLKGELNVHSSSFQGRKAGWKDALKVLYFRLTCRKRAIKNNKKVIIITDEFSNAYFHWVADCLPKLISLCEVLQEYLLILPAYMTEFPFVRESLSAWPELEVQYCENKEYLRFQSAIIVPALAPTGNYRPQIMMTLRQKLVNRFAGFDNNQINRKVYISRTKAKYRKILNEAELEPNLEKAGFEKVFMEDLTFAEQVKLLSETKYLVSNHGAGLTNILFMMPETKALEIRLQGDDINNCYFSLASAVGVKYYYFLAESATEDNDSHTAHLTINSKYFDEVIAEFMK